MNEINVEQLNSNEFLQLANKDMLYQRSGGREGDHVKFTGNKMQHLNVNGSHLYQLDLSHKDFSGLDLSNTVFFNCDISYSNFDNTTINKCSFENCIATHASFIAAKGDDPNFSFMRMDDADFPRAQFVEPVFYSANGKNVNIQYGSFVGGTWDCAKLPFLQADHAKMDYGSMRQTDVSNGSFISATLKNVDATRAVMNNINGMNASFDHMLLISTQLCNANTDKLYMPSVIIHDAKMDFLLAQYGPVNTKMDTVSYNITKDQISMPGYSGTVSLKEFERDLKDDKMLKAVAETFNYAQKMQKKQNSR